MKNVNAKNFSSVTNQITAIERYETKKLNMSTLDKIAEWRYRCNVFFLWIWRRTNDFVQMFSLFGNMSLKLCLSF